MLMQHGPLLPVNVRVRNGVSIKFVCPYKCHFFLCLFFSLLTTTSQSQTITVRLKDAPLRQVLDTLETQAGYGIFYKQGMLEQARRVTLNVKNMPLKDFLELLLKDQPFTYRIADKTIALFLRDSLASAAAAVPASGNSWLVGKVTDSRGHPIDGATIIVKGTHIMARSAPTGEFRLPDVPSGAALVISCVGYQRKEVVWKNGGGLTIQLETAIGELGGVTVNAGIVTRNKYTFTGATGSFTGAQLKTISNGNIIQSLRTLDPSFIQIENNRFGSDPNKLPQLEIRGKSGISTTQVNDIFKNNPNQPLFILNGMETTLRQIVDLDVNRVANITVLKDAASTALYGSRAANGVVVVETKRPVNGEITVSYTFDGTYSFPDLTSFNMMNAAENLEFQKLAGLFTADRGSGGEVQYELDEVYNRRKIAVLSGRNYSWLNVPLRNVVTHGHTLYIDGGDERLAFGVGLSYKQQPGVMKGSQRRTYGANADLTYRHGKLIVSNQFYLSGSAGTDSPYGPFKDYVNINPYFSYFDDQGGLNHSRYFVQDRQLQSAYGYEFFSLANPVYNALLNSTSGTKGLNLQDNLSVIYDIIPSLRFSGGLQISRDDAESEQLISPANTMFDSKDQLQRGSYSKSRTVTMDYQGNVMLTFSKVLAAKHSITANIRGEGQYRRSCDEGFTAVGFPDVAVLNPAFAFSYKPDSRPDYAEQRVVRISSLASVNYAYNTRYFMDLTYRMDGSSIFGSNKLFTPFMSAGAGWNLNRESFLQGLRTIDELRLRANIGSTGNQNLGSVLSASVYNYTPGVNPYGLRYVLNQLGNPDADWQKTVQTSIGIDLTMFNRRLTATVNGYRKVTDRLLINAALPPSSGVTQLPANLGSLHTTGAEVLLSYAPIYRLEKEVVWTVSLTGSIIRSRFANIGSRLDYFNNKLLSDAALIRYKDGYSPDEVWAVPSAGIDPVSGQEVYKSRTGLYTFKYDPLDIAPLGSSQPLIQGIFGTSLRLKGFSASLNFRYSTGACRFNEALYNKVENISTDELEFNQDKRALYERWKQPGDVKAFRSIAISADDISMSSRFVQKERYISAESISVGYQLFNKNSRLLKCIRAKSLRATAYMNEIFRVSNIRLERGTEYPYTRSFSFSLNATF